MPCPTTPGLPTSCACCTADAKDKYDRDGDVAKGADALVWQALASVIVPGFVVNRVVAAARLATKLPMTATVAGLASIPIIIKPIDHAVDLGLDATLRPWLFPPKAD
mmetsp:Transcript_30142/g.93231  ORF Transcript_30142/g.93231 Transcript_30142/m.93231 type:complete len:107 (-) Transcript_30142:35-355(-)